MRSGVKDYDIPTPGGTRIAKLLYVGHSGIQVLPTTEVRLDDDESGWRTSGTNAAVSAWYYLPDKKTIRLALTPDTTASKALKITAALKPTQTTENLADNLYDDHYEAISFGALKRLLSMKGKPWHDPDLASYYMAEFERAKVKEKAERLGDYTRESTLTVPPIDYYG